MLIERLRKKKKLSKMRINKKNKKRRPLSLPLFPPFILLIPSYKYTCVLQKLHKQTIHSL